MSKNTPDPNLDRHTFGVLPGGPVSGFERLNCQLDADWVAHHLRGTFQCQPSCTVDLTDCRNPSLLDVAHLPGAIRADDPHQPGLGVVSEGDGHHVGGVVAAQGGKGGQVSLYEKPEFVSGEVGRFSHLSGRYLKRPSA